MRAALRGQYVQYVQFMGVSERYPQWFVEEISDRVFTNESRFSFWTSPQERESDYYEKELIETHSIVVRKPDGVSQVMTTETFNELYYLFTYDQSLNGGVAAFHEDCIEYVEFYAGRVLDNYPEWVYEYFSECLNHPDKNETYFLGVDSKSCIMIDKHSVLLRNRFNELKKMLYSDFLKYYDPRTSCERWWEECPF